MAKIDKNLETRIVIPLSGDALGAALALRADAEMTTGVPTSITSVVKAAVLSELKRVIEAKVK